MKNNLFPTGEAIEFIGSLDLDKIFGIVRCKVTSPSDLYVPILLTQTVDGRVIAPVGSWTGWYVSEELKFAVKHGYKVEVLEGYRYEQKFNIFSGYVSDLYKIRQTFSKTNVRNFISKLLMNSLYGPLRDRFGMIPILS